MLSLLTKSLKQVILEKKLATQYYGLRPLRIARAIIVQTDNNYQADTRKYRSITIHIRLLSCHYLDHILHKDTYSLILRLPS